MVVVVVAAMLHCEGYQDTFTAWSSYAHEEYNMTIHPLSGETAGLQMLLWYWWQ